MNARFGSLSARACIARRLERAVVEPVFLGLGSGDGVRCWVEAANVHPAPSRAFEVDARALIAACEQPGLHLEAILHGHLGSDPSPSVADRLGLLTAGYVAWPGVAWVIVARAPDLPWVHVSVAQGRMEVEHHARWLTQR